MVRTVWVQFSRQLDQKTGAIKTFEMQIELAYGKGRIKAEIPDHIHTEVVEPRM